MFGESFSAIVCEVLMWEGKGGKLSPVEKGLKEFITLRVQWW